MIVLRRLLAALVLAWALIALPAMADPKFPALTGRVVDDAHLLSADQVAQLNQLSAQVEQASSRQFVVATIPDLQGYPIEEYGYQLGRAWGIGQKGANNGIILIVAPNDRKVRIEVGYGLEPIMTDALSNRIIQEQILPHFRDKDMAGGIIAGATAIAEQMKLPLEAAEARAKAASAQPPQAQRRHQGGFPVGLIFWIVIFFFVIVPMFARGARGRAYRGGGGGSGWAPIVLWSIANEIGRESGRRGGWGGGDWGGGGSGWGGGGGGGGFSGGGGSFGGGGASGSW